MNDKIISNAHNRVLEEEEEILEEQLKMYIKTNQLYNQFGSEYIYFNKVKNIIVDREEEGIKKYKIIFETVFKNESPLKSSNESNYYLTINYEIENGEEIRDYIKLESLESSEEIHTDIKEYGSIKDIELEDSDFNNIHQFILKNIKISEWFRLHQILEKLSVS